MSSGGGKSTTTTKVERDPVEQAQRNKIGVQAGGLYDWAMDDFDANGYQGPQPVGMSSATEAGLGSMWNAAHRMEGNNAQAQEANSFGLKDALYADSNPYLQSAMDAATRPMIQQFMDAGGPMSQIRSGAVGNGTYGGSRQGVAEGLAMGRLAQGVLDTRAQMSSDAYYKGLEQMQNSIKNQAMLNMMSLMPGEAMGKVGARYEQEAQDQENYRAAQWDYYRNKPWQDLQNYANIVYGNNDAGTSTTQQMPRQDNTGQILGTLGTMGMMAMMFSDERLKSHITKLTDHVRGFGIYLYKIFGQWQIGVLAQEVEKVLPEAVHTHPSGYKMVDYAAL